LKEDAIARAIAGPFRFNQILFPSTADALQ
jgi:hypothetical protein